MVRRLALLLTIAAGLAVGKIAPAQNPAESDFYKLISVHTSKSSQH